LPVVIAARSYGEIAMVSFGSLAFTIALIVFVGVEGQYANRNFQLPDLWPSDDWAAVRQLGILAYATNCQYATLEAHAAMTPEAKARFTETMGLAIVLGTISLVAMAFVGYGSFGDNTMGNIFANFDATLPGVQAGYLCVCIHLFLYIPNDFVICRLFILDLFNQDPRTMPFVPYLIVTLLLLAAPLVLMASVPRADVDGAFSFVISLTGDVPTSWYAFVIPPVLYLSAFRNEVAALRNHAYAIITVGLFLAFVSPTLDVARFIHVCGSAEGCNAF